MHHKLNGTASARPTSRLVHHDARAGHSKALALCTCRQEHRGGAGAQPQRYCGDIWLDSLNGVK